MRTEIIKVDINTPGWDRQLDYAADVIKRGGLAAFPTETVYGLGANALNEKAVTGIFAAKGRPSDNPLIVHIADQRELESLTSSVPSCAAGLIYAFWPGPLTLVMPKASSVPGVITAGLDTVAVRMPSHPVALALIKKSGVPVAAPSANVSGRPSPTLASHVIEDLDGKVDVIIDGGKVEVGLESTVLDITAEPPMILRPGGITYEQLRGQLGEVRFDPSLLPGGKAVSVPRAPGMKYRHYAPKAKVVIVQGSFPNVVEKINSLSRQNGEAGIKTGILATDESKEHYGGAYVVSMGSRKSPATIAANLFESLRYFDGTDIQMIIAEAIDGDGIGMAVMNRLDKAAGHNIIKV